MSTTDQTSTLPAAVDAQVYSEILQFYARQVQLLDEGRAEDWARQFTEDGEFRQNVKPEPRRGRLAIAESMRKGMDSLAARGLTRRHWFGMIVAEPEADGVVRTRYYAMVFETPRGGQARVYLSTTAEDVLECHGGEWLVRSRLVSHDGV